MRKIAAVFCIAFGLFVLTISTSRTLMEKISGKRENAPWKIWWGPHQVDHAGDLARMGYLERIEKYRDTVIHNYAKAEAGNRSVNLYVWGDSYVMYIPDSVFYGLRSYHYARRDYADMDYDLDTRQKNILVIELGERFLRRYYHTPDTMFRHVKKAGTTARLLLPAITGEIPKAYASFAFPGVRVSAFFNPAINQNIEYNLFTYNFLNPVRRFKAEMNARFFSRGSGDVVISEDGNFLLLRETVGRELESSTIPVPEKEINHYISILNQVYDHYKQQGFDEVYLSVIPNPVSVIQPHTYNGMLPGIQNPGREHKLRMPLIDLYKIFKESGDPASYYQHGDTHWNEKGMQAWLHQVNDILYYWDNKTK